MPTPYPEVEASPANGLVWSPTPVSTQGGSAAIGNADLRPDPGLVGTSLKRKSPLNPQPATHRRAGGGGKLWPKGPERQARRCQKHKRNPIRSERISGLARVLRATTVAALENVALWHERDIKPHSVERMMLPDCSVTPTSMLREMTAVIRGLGVLIPANMQRTEALWRLVFSQRVLLALVEAWAWPARAGLRHAFSGMSQ